VRSTIGVDDQRSVVVTELACTEPGCPPIETVVGLLGPGAQTQYKLHKPVAEVTEADVVTALQGKDLHP